MHSYVTFMFPYVNLVLRVLSHPFRLSLRRDGSSRASRERGRPYITPCYSYVFAMYPYVSVCNLYVSVWCFSRDRNLASCFAVKGSNPKVI